MLEEAERGVGDCEETLVVPDDEGVVELLCSGESGEIPWLEDHVRLKEVQGVGAHVTAFVDVFWVSTCGNSSVGGNASVEGIDVAECIHIDLEVGEGYVGTRLEGGRIAACVDVKGMYRRKDGVCVDA